jgi:hypothetical protein
MRVALRLVDPIASALAVASIMGWLRNERRTEPESGGWNLVKHNTFAQLGTRRPASPQISLNRQFHKKVGTRRVFKMAEWKVIFQDTPFNFTTPAALVIKADDVEQALATAYDHLTRAGHAVAKIVPDAHTPSEPYFEQTPKDVDLDKLKKLLGPNVNLEYMPGSTHIRGCLLHQVSNLGTVLHQ